MSLESRILTLILDAKGASLPAETRAEISQDPALTAQLQQIIADVERRLPPVTEPEMNNESLRPGQIPSAPQPATKAPLPARPPAARVTIANARAGESFSSPVEVALEDGVRAEATEVMFPRDIGLHFDKDSQTLAGIPAESGDFNVTVRWLCPSQNPYETTLLFVVNPDPRSLWKVIEPPADAPYFKAHIDHKTIVSGDIYLAAASRRGRSHEHAGSFRDDDFYIASNESGWSVMLVADGAGSAKNSREGSRIATTVAGEYLSRQFTGEEALALKARILQWDTDDQLAAKEIMLRHFRQAAKLAVSTIQHEAVVAEQEAKSYATTLLATVAFREGETLFAAAFWLGDGAIAAYGPAGRVRLLGTPDSGEYAGQTRFLDNDAIDDPAFNNRIKVGKWNDVTHLLLMTDGVSDPRFETDNGLQNAAKWDALMADLNPCLADEALASERLAEWLTFFSPGNHDDRTLIVAGSR